MNNRIKELDFLKCVFIVLMVMFHLVYFGDKYPYLKQVVYTFHMPAFLLLSGYLANWQKPAGSFGKKMLWIIVPYLVMEAGYTVMASVLPIREHLEHLDAAVLAEKLFLHPLGPYWYLHTLILCEVIYYGACRLARQDAFLRIVLTGLACYALSLPGIQLISLANAFYFVAGAAILQSGLSFLQVFCPSPYSAVPVVLLCCHSGNLDRFTLGGVAITYLVISLLLWFYRFVAGKTLAAMQYIGRNTLVVLLFSPVFTVLSKLFVPFFSFDPSGLCFMVVAVAFTLGGCFAVARLMELTGFSTCFFGRRKVLV